MLRYEKKGITLPKDIDAIAKIEEFTQDMDFNDFIQDDKTASAVVRKLEIVGETIDYI